MAKATQASASELVPTELRLHNPGVHVQSIGSLMSTFRAAEGWKFVEDPIGVVISRGPDVFRAPWNTVRSVHYEAE